MTDYEDKNYVPRETLYVQSGVSGRQLMKSEISIDQRTDTDDNSSRGPFYVMKNRSHSVLSS